MEFLLVFVGMYWSNPKDSTFISACDKEYDEKSWTIQLWKLFCLSDACLFCLILNFSSFYDDVRGHSKSTFVEEGTGGRSLKSEQKRTGGEGVLTCVCVRFFKQNAEIFKIKFYSYSPVFPIYYNGSMKYKTNHHERL